ncbi:MAG: MFS transporter [Ardenticatenaceae bacterium]|nr:MFS transporter [Anaerolineales bacterium]MCB8922500.1 MFS transporter [Ardenticatenaceae bacterium]MCB8989969.1 MFS transporter [Ardenticatenaceae bacterium]MCB9005412.1 MFS transporter [Ardenticatenaceae bacterium]
MSTTPARPPLRQLPRNVWIVTITSFLTDISSEMVLNLLPLFLANVLGVRTNVIGLIEGLAESTASLLKILSGWISDKLGQRKGLAVVGYGLSSIAKPLLYFVTSWWGVLAVRFGDRVGKGIRTAPRDALIADSIGEEHRGLAYGLHRAGDTAGAMIGILIALAVVWFAQAGDVNLERPTFQRVVLFSILPAVLAVLILGFGAREAQAKKKAELPKLTWAGFDQRFRRFLLVLVLFTLGNSADAFLILRAQERGLSVLGILAMLAMFNLVYALLSGPLGSLSDRIGRERLITGGWLVYGVLYLGFALAETAVHIFLLYALYGVYYAAVEGTAKAFVADIVSKEQRGTAFGLYNAAVGIAVLPASLIAGILWQGLGGWAGFGPAAPFIWGAMLAGTAVLLFRTWVMTAVE